MKKNFLSPFALALNTYLKLDPESEKRLHKLQGNVITIEFLPFHFVFQCIFSEQGMDIQPDELLPAATKICGTPLQMYGVMMTKEHRNRFFADDISITGDAALGQQVIELFDELQIDWEEQISRFIGDVPAHHVGRFVRDMGDWLLHAEKSFAKDVNDYVHEEKRWLPSREALHDFFNEVDSIRMDVDRIEARINHLRISFLNALTENGEPQ